MGSVADRLAMDDELRREMLSTMVTIREFESAVQNRFADAQIPGFLHLYVGQEAMATGVCRALAENDHLTSTHRGHGHCIARGLDVREMAAELYGRRDGYCNGKGGSMHIADVEAGMLGANGIVAGGIPVATGAAVSSEMRDTDEVAVAFFGDGALSEGAFHESFNLAATWELPLVGIVENNQYGEMTGLDEQHPEAVIDDLTQYGEAYGIDRRQVDGMDVEAVYETATEVVDNARDGGGPALIECVGYRYRGHHEGDSEFYRSDDEKERWSQRDPVETYSARLVAEGVISESGIESLHADVVAEIEAAIDFARNSDWPNPEEAYEGLYSDGGRA